MGGHSVTLASALRPSAFSALVLFDPVIRAKDDYRGPWKKTEFVAKRRNRWASAAEMFERFENRPLHPAGIARPGSETRRSDAYPALMKRCY